MKKTIACLIFLFALTNLFGCSKNSDSDKRPANGGAQPASSTSPAMEAAQIIDRNRALDNSLDSRTKLKARIQGPDGTPPEVEMNIYRKRKADGNLMMLIEFTAPAQERDRSALVTINPQSEVEGVRYVQSGDTFVSTKGVMSEDSLFGMTLQELADGQVEKYDFKVVGEDTSGPIAAYKLDGTLKPGAESRFNRLVLLVSKENFSTVGAEFYDNHNELVRRLSVDKIEPVANHPTRMHWTVDNPAKTKRVEFTALETKYDQNLSDSLFTREHLKKISAK